MKTISIKDIGGEWQGISLADDLLEYELQIRKGQRFELRDIENEELIMGVFSIEQAHGIYYFVLNAVTEVLVFEWNGKEVLKSDLFIFQRSEKQDSSLFY